MSVRLPRVPRWFLEVAVITAVLSLTRASLADHYVVPSGSMKPSVQIGDHVCVAKASYGVRVPFTEDWLLQYDAPNRGDVVVLHSPESGDVLLKRVVAVEGDEVTVRDGIVTTSGARESSTAYPLRLDAGGGPDFGPVRVPRDQVLVMGDNRGDSHDGRVFGFVRRGAVLGRALSVCVRDGAPTWQPL